MGGTGGTCPSQWEKRGHTIFPEPMRIFRGGVGGGEDNMASGKSQRCIYICCFNCAPKWTISSLNFQGRGLGRGSPSPLPRPLPCFFWASPSVWASPSILGRFAPSFVHQKYISMDETFLCPFQWESLDPPLSFSHYQAAVYP